MAGCEKTAVAAAAVGFEILAGDVLENLSWSCCSSLNVSGKNTTTRNINTILNGSNFYRLQGMLAVISILTLPMIFESLNVV